MPNPLTNQYPAIWLRLEAFCALTGYTEEAVRANRKRGTWPDGVITCVRGRNIHVNVREYDNWVATGLARWRAA